MDVIVLRVQDIFNIVTARRVHDILPCRIAILRQSTPFPFLLFEVLLQLLHINWIRMPISGI